MQRGIYVMKNVRKNIVFFICLSIFLAQLSGFLWASQEETQESTAKKHFLTFFLSGNYAPANGGDLNDLIIGTAESHTGSLSFFDWDKLKSVTTLNFEVIYQISERLGAGLGLGFLSGKNDGNYGWKMDQDVFIENSRQYNFRTFILSGNIYYYFPLTEKFKVFVTGGCDFYFGKLNHNHDSIWDYQFEDTSSYWIFPIDDPNAVPELVTETDNIKVAWDWAIEERLKKTSLGLHVGAGIDININRTFSATFAALLKRVNFKNGSGTYSASGSLSADENYEGNIWFIEGTNPMLKVLENEPSGGQKANFHLGGVTLLIGIKAKIPFRLFR